MEKRQSEARERKSTSGWMKTMRSVKSPRETNEKTQRVPSATHDWSARRKFGAGADACAISPSPTRRSLISFLLCYTLEYTCRGRRNPTITAIQPSDRWTISGRFAIFSCRDPPVTVLPWTGATRRISTAFTIFFPFFFHLSNRASRRLPNFFSVLVQSNPHTFYFSTPLFFLATFPVVTFQASNSLERNQRQGTGMYNDWRRYSNMRILVKTFYEYSICIIGNILKFH